MLSLVKYNANRGPAKNLIRFMFNFDPFEPMQTVCGVDGQRVDGVGLEAEPARQYFTLSVQSLKRVSLESDLKLSVEWGLLYNF